MCRLSAKTCAALEPSEGIFIQHRKHLLGPPVAQFVVHKIDAPDVINLKQFSNTDAFKEVARFV